MENRGSKGLALAALIVGVVGLTIGFAAFSAQLQINETTATYTAEDSTFVNSFGFALKDETSTGGGKVEADYDKIWSAIKASFTTLNETKEYTATIKNDSKYVAYLHGVTTPTATCTAVGETTDTLVQDACTDVKMTVSAPATIAAGDSATVTVTITGPKKAVDGTMDVSFSSVAIDYKTVAKQ